MAEEGNGWTKELLIAGILAPIVGAVVSPLVEGLLGSVGVSLGWLTWISDGVVAAATYEVRVWQLALGLLAAGIGYYGWNWLQEPEVLNWRNAYRRDQIKDVDWVWQWNEEDQPVGLTPICPNCDMEMTYKNTGLYESGLAVLCEKCGTSQRWDVWKYELDRFLKKEIRRRVRTGEWHN